jgi:phosphate transport system protein
MTVLMHKEFERLKKSILSLAAMVEEAFKLSVRSVVETNAATAESVIEGDRRIDQMEIEVEEECLKILALHQPVAVDLRYIVVVLKMNNDFERVGDLAVGIARNAREIARLGVPETPFDIQPMAELVRGMLTSSLDALVNLDAELADKVLERDKQVDALHKDMYNRAIEHKQEHREQFDCVQRVLSIARNLERIADHATNVAEDVIYLVRGDIVRHGAGLSEPSPVAKQG